MASQTTKCYTDSNFEVTNHHKVIITNFKVNHIPIKFQVRKLVEKMFILTITAQKDTLQRNLEIIKLESDYSLS